MGPSDAGKCLCCWSKRSCMHSCQRFVPPGLFGQPCQGSTAGLETFFLLGLFHLNRLQCPFVMSPSTHTPVLSIPTGKRHSPAQPTQSKDKQYIFAFLHSSKEMHPRCSLSCQGSGLMAQTSVFLASWVVTCIHRVGMRRMLNLALLCVAKTLTVLGHSV